MTKTFINIATLLVLTLGIVYASNSTKAQNSDLTMTYKNMSTTELQIEVEKLSNQGQLPFAMGKELMSRWSAPQNEVN